MEPYDPDTPQTGPPGTSRKKQQRYLRSGLIAAGVLVVAFTAAGVAGCAGHKSAAPPRPAVAVSVAPASTSAAPSVPVATPTDTPAPVSTPVITVSQQQALDSAQSYLSDGQGFSRAGLIGQLTSSYGEGFSAADATWAVDHSGADWDAQAVMSAKGYMNMGGFSRAGLIDQLTSPYGEQFTYAQATYAVNQVGL